MPMLDPVEVIFTAQATQLLATMKEIEAQTTKMDANFSKMTGMEKMQSVANVSSKALLGFGAVLVGVGATAIHAFDQVEKASVTAQTAVTNLGLSYTKVQPAFDAQAKSMTNLGFKYADTIGALGTLTTALGDPAKAMSLMNTVADLARKNNTDLATTADMVAKATAGSARAFADLGIKVDRNLTPQAAFNLLIDQANGKLNGLAQNFAKTVPGAIDVTNAKLNLTQVSLGKALAPAMGQLAGIAQTVLVPALNAIANTVSAAPGAFELLAGGLLAAGVAMKAFAAVTAMADSALGALLLEAAPFAAIAVGLVALIELLHNMPNQDTSGKMGPGGSVSGTATTSPTFDPLHASLLPPSKSAKTPDKPTPPKKPLTPAEQLAADQAAAVKAYEDSVKSFTAINNAQNAALQASVQKAVTIKSTGNKIMDAINKTYYDSATAAYQAYADAELSATKTLTDTEQSIQENFQQQQLALTQQYTKQYASIILQNIQQMTGAFATSTALNVGDLFNQMLGGIANNANIGTLVAQFNRRLVQAQQLAQGANQLSALGFSQTFIDQVVGMGAQQGNLLVNAITSATPDQIKALQDSFNSLNTVSNTGVTALATTMSNGVDFATQQLAQQYAQVTTDYNNALTDLNNQTQIQLDAAQRTFTASMADAKSKLDTSLKNSYDALAQSFQASGFTAKQATDDVNNFMKSIISSSPQMKDYITALQTVNTLLGSPLTVSGLGGQTAGQQILATQGLAQSSAAAQAAVKQNLGTPTTSAGVTQNISVISVGTNISAADQAAAINYGAVAVTASSDTTYAITGPSKATQQGIAAKLATGPFQGNIYQ